jgi:hypothetical protein
MPKISGEGTLGLALEILLAILDHLHIREPLLIWGLFLVGLILISDSILRSDWASKPTEKATRIKRRAFGIILVLGAFAIFGFWINSRAETEASSPSAQPAATIPESQTNQSATATGDGGHNTSGNINQNGNNDNAVIGNGNKVGNTYNITDSPTRLGWLKPANENLNDGICGLSEVKKDAGVLVMLGNNIGWSTQRSWPFPLNVLRISKRVIISLDRNKNGEIAVNADVFNEKDDVVVTIEKNKFTISDEAFQVETPDKSTLRVTIKRKKETVLSIHYSNNYVIRITGHFHYEGRDILVTEDQGLVVNPGNTTLSGSCYGNMGTLFTF